jgi:hypothetical protein
VSVIARKADAGGGPAIGPRTTLVTVELFCNVTSRRRCQRSYGLVEKLAARHPRDLRVVYRALPGPSQVDQFSAMEKEAWHQSPDRFFELQRVIYAQVVLIPGRDLERIAGEAGLDLEALSRALAEGVHERALAVDQVWASRYGALRAPTHVWNGEVGSSDDSLADLETAFADARARAEELVRNGVPLHRLPELFAARSEKVGGFTLDAAATEANAKCSDFYTEHGLFRFAATDCGFASPVDLTTNGLTGPWEGRVWINPPFSQIAAWVAKCCRESAAGRVELIEMLIPSTRTEQAWWQRLVEPARDGRGTLVPGYSLTTEFLAKRPKFLKDGVQLGSPKFGCVILHWERTKKHA